MRSRRPSPEHQDAVSRRLALLSAELSAARSPAAPTAEPPPDGEWWDEHTRLATPRTAPPALPGPPARPAPHGASPVPLPDHPPAVPVPGRHAARRARPGSGLLPPTLRGRVLLGPAQLAVVAVLVALGLAVTAWWVVRSDAEPAAGESVAAAPASALVPLEPVSTAQDVGAATVGTGATAAPSPVTVDVAGKVRRPGIAVLDAGARVVDALEAAGGVRPGADVAGLNLARVLVDGEQILVGVPAPPGVAAATVPAAGAPPAALVDLNTADGGQLEALPEVGPVTAASILAWREAHGGFTSVDELLEIDGIGEATLAKIAPHVTV
jgi:competence protein ComEA